jgi:hypothetical protein
VDENGQIHESVSKDNSSDHFGKEEGKWQEILVSLSEIRTLSTFN